MKDLAPLDSLTRWRLILGRTAEGVYQQAGHELSGTAAEMDASMGWLYDREEEGGDRNIAPEGGTGGSCLTTPQWINEIHRLFPRETIERLERDAIERYAIEDVVTNPAVLARIEPSETLLKAVLRTRYIMSPDVLAMARKLVQETVRRLMATLSQEVSIAFTGVRDRRRNSRFRTSGALDFRRVIHDNLRHYDPVQRKIVPERLHFFQRNQRSLKPWQIILLVDQSGSMIDSVIHSAVTAACLWGLPGVRTHLVAFDTSVVDLTQDVDDPCELLMKVQLGGGTDIQKAVAYAADLIEYPEQAIVVLISDFYEGGSKPLLVSRVAALVAQRTKVLALGALDAMATAAYDREMARSLLNVGADVGAMTPGELANWLAEKIGR